MPFQSVVSFLLGRKTGATIDGGGDTIDGSSNVSFRGKSEKGINLLLIFTESQVTVNIVAFCSAKNGDTIDGDNTINGDTIDDGECSRLCLVRQF